KQGMTYKDVKMQYLGNSVELTNAFIAGQLDVMSSIEPYATKGLTATKGNVLGDGVDMYGPGYPDCVLIARKELIAKDPKVVKDADAGSVNLTLLEEVIAENPDLYKRVKVKSA